MVAAVVVVSVSVAAVVVAAVVAVFVQMVVPTSYVGLTGGSIVGDMKASSQGDDNVDGENEKVGPTDVAELDGGEAGGTGDDKVGVAVGASLMPLAARGEISFVCTSHYETFVALKILYCLSRFIMLKGEETNAPMNSKDSPGTLFETRGRTRYRMSQTWSTRIFVPSHAPYIRE